VSVLLRIKLQHDEQVFVRKLHPLGLGKGLQRNEDRVAQIVVSPIQIRSA